MDQCLLVAQLCILPVHPSTAPLPSLTLPTSTLPPLRSSSAADQCLLVAQLCILCNNLKAGGSVVLRLSMTWNHFRCNNIGGEG